MDKIDEVSRTALMNYTTRATGDIKQTRDRIEANKKTGLGTTNPMLRANIRKRQKGFQKAVYKLSSMKEEAMSNIKDAVIAGFDGKFDQMRTLVHASLNEKAVAALDGVKHEIASSLFSGVGSQDSPLSEESEQLQELSKGKLYKYAGKAAKSAHSLQKTAGSFEDEAERREKVAGQVKRFQTIGDPDESRAKAQKFKNKADRRSQFFNKAVKRISEEDVGGKKDFEQFNARTDDDVGMHTQKKGVKKDKPNYTKGNEGR
jgi:hypothetical protein